jgi:hypothetical protein
VGHEVYSFLDGFFGYRQIQIALEDGYKMIFRSICLGGYAIWAQKCAPTYQRVMNKSFKNYLDDFMKLFLDDFTIFSDLDTHLPKLQ